MTTLTDGIVDYAGLFPPAALDIASAVRFYGEYLADPHRALLARFVVPVGRLAEFAEARRVAPSHGVSPGSGSAAPWRLAALAGADAAIEVKRIDEFNQRHRDLAVVDVVEAKASSSAEIDHMVHVFFRAASVLQMYIELPVAADLDPLAVTIARLGVRAKIRTGGVTADAFPSPDQVVNFMRVCFAHHVPLKATAGLHHPIYGVYPLTYEPESPKGPMYGFLNVFLAAAFLRAGLKPSEVTEVLTERDIGAFRFDDTGLTWRSHPLTIEQIRHTRQHVALSFGSCSFREPVDELTALHLL